MTERLIISNPDILNGKPILKGYPTLTLEGLEAALDFAARQFEGEEVKAYTETK